MTSEIETTVHVYTEDEQRFRRWAMDNNYGDSYTAFKAIMDQIAPEPGPGEPVSGTQHND